jgi:two-component system response regulator YesN
MTPIKILVKVIDDTEFDRDKLIKRLSESGFDVEGFSNAEDFKVSITKNVNLVITDVKIPHYDVFETLDFLHSGYPGISIIVISGYFDNNIYKRLIRAGVDDTVEKGYSSKWVDELMERIDILMPRILKKKELTDDYS